LTNFKEGGTNVKRIHIWLIAWVSLAADILEILCLGFVIKQWKLKAAEYFAGFRTEESNGSQSD